jgi:hypothetical protein
MNEAVPQTYILPVPGTDETQELPRSVVLERLAKGELTPADWIWSPPDQDWKTVAEIPSLQPALPAPKKSFLGPLAPIGPKQKIEPITAPTLGLPPAKKKKKVKPKRTRSEYEDEPSRLGTFVCVLILALFAVVAVNYQFVDRPLDGNLAQTQFVLVPAHAHLGAFFQRDKLVIHILPTSELNSDNFADFLFALANSTPPPPFGATGFTVIELTPAWRGQYAFTGDDWQHLGKMTTSTARDRKDFILEHIDDASGDKLVSASLDAATNKTTRDEVWRNLAGSFHAEGTEGNMADGSFITSAIGMISSLVSRVSGAAPHTGSGTSSADSKNAADSSTNSPPQP